MELSNKIVPKSVQKIRTDFGTFVNKHFVPFLVRYNQLKRIPLIKQKGDTNMSASRRFTISA